MIESSYSLYKLIVLYMLKKVNFPLTNAQISDFILGQEYTSYFHLQQVLTEMVESSLIQTEAIRNATYYRMTENGAQTLEFFEKEISPEIKRDITNYLVTHSYEMRNESSTLADYYRTSNQDFAVHCMVKEGKTEAVTGKEIFLKPDSICVHGDSPKALEFVAKIRKGLESAGVEVVAF